MPASLQLVYILFLLVLASSSIGTKSDSGTNASLLNLTKNSTSHPLLALVTARHLKQRMSSFVSNIPIIPHQSGAFIPLSFGTPPQIFNMFVDTASSLTWLPCNYTFTKDIKTKRIFSPSLSSSSKFLECNHPSSRWFDNKKPDYQCENSKAHGFENCSRLLHYHLTYAKGSTSGTLLLESLHIPKRTVKDFIVGCSNPSSEHYGIVGFGRNAESFSSQLSINKFSYCLPNGHFIQRTQTSFLVLNDQYGSHSGDISYTSFHKNPSKYEVDAYYYVTLEGIIIGNKRVKIPRELLVPKSDGNGGTIVDSGSTSTYLHISIFNKVARAFHKQLGKGSLYREATCIRFCFYFSLKEVKTLPKLTLQFKDGAMMIIPWQNYLTEKEDGFNCLSMVTPNFLLMQSVVLGNTLMRDFYVEFDLKQERLGFLSKKCT